MYHFGNTRQRDPFEIDGNLLGNFTPLGTELLDRLPQSNNRYNRTQPGAQCSLRLRGANLGMGSGG